MIRGGLGLFYDLGYGNVGAAAAYFPYNRNKRINDSTLPFNPAAFTLPPFSASIDSNVLTIPAVDPNLRLPFTIQWNTAIEVRMGANQTLTATYVGADGRRLLQQTRIRTAELLAVAPDGAVWATLNSGYSHYNALQVQFQRRMSRGLQALMSYNWRNQRYRLLRHLVRPDRREPVAQSVPPPYRALRLRYPALAVRSRFLRDALACGRNRP